MALHYNDDPWVLVNTLDRSIHTVISLDKDLLHTYKSKFMYPERFIIVRASSTGLTKCRLNSYTLLESENTKRNVIVNKINTFNNEPHTAGPLYPTKSGRPPFTFFE